MAALTPDQYRFVVEKLAEGDTPAGIVSELCRRWRDAPEVEPSEVAAAFRREKLSPPWREFFDKHREAFEKCAPTKDKEFRIALLDKLAREAASSGNTERAARLLEQIAKEQSGFYAGKAATNNSGALPPITFTRVVIDPKQDGGDAESVPATPGKEPV